MVGYAIIQLNEVFLANQSHSFQLVYNAIYSLVNAHDQNDINMAT